MVKFRLKPIPCFPTSTAKTRQNKLKKKKKKKIFLLLLLIPKESKRETYIKNKEAKKSDLGLWVSFYMAPKGKEALPGF